MVEIFCRQVEYRLRKVKNIKVEKHYISKRVLKLQPLLCGGRAIVASEEDCPFRAFRDDIIGAKNSEFLLDKVLTRTRSTHTKKLNGSLHLNTLIQFLFIKSEI